MYDSNKKRVTYKGTEGRLVQIPRFHGIKNDNKISINDNFTFRYYNLFLVLVIFLCFFNATFLLFIRIVIS